MFENGKMVSAEVPTISPYKMKNWRSEDYDVKKSQAFRENSYGCHECIYNDGVFVLETKQDINAAPMNDILLHKWYDIIKDHDATVDNDDPDYYDTTLYQGHCCRSDIFGAFADCDVDYKINIYGSYGLLDAYGKLKIPENASSIFKSKDLAFAACPQKQSICGNNKEFDIRVGAPAAVITMQGKFK